MAVGIGLVFGVLRLINFAYGQLIMVGAYTLAFTASWPVAASIAACFVVVVALSTVMDRVVFRPLRGESPAVMLVTTFAIAFAVLQRRCSSTSATTRSGRSRPRSRPSTSRSRSAASTSARSRSWR